MSGLPVQACPHGYNLVQLAKIFGDDIAGFHAWFGDRKSHLCEGRRWSPFLGRDVASACAPDPHGVVVYPRDVTAYLREVAS